MHARRRRERTRWLGVAAAVLLCMAACRERQVADSRRTTGPPRPVKPAALPSTAALPLVTEVACASGARCQVASSPVRLKMRTYSDASYTLIAANTELLGTTLIQTAHADSVSTLDPLLTFTLLRPARVYVAGAFPTPGPPWLEGWTWRFSETWPGGIQLLIEPRDVDVRELTVYSRDMEPGPVALGPVQTARESPDRTAMMYLVLLHPLGEERRKGSSP